MDVAAEIKKHGLEIKPVMGESYEDEDGVVDEEGELQYWSCFPMFEGGCWGDGDTLEEAISNCIKENNLRG